MSPAMQGPPKFVAPVQVSGEASDAALGEASSRKEGPSKGASYICQLCAGVSGSICAE